MIVNSISIDVLEMVVVISGSYNLFITLKDVVIKLQEPSRVSRINDKLTITHLNIRSKYYVCEALLTGIPHKEYNKPYIVFYDGDMIWCKYNKHYRDNDLPMRCSIFYRRWFSGGIHDDSLPVEITIEGGHSWYSNWNNDKTCCDVLTIDINARKYLIGDNKMRCGFDYI